MNAHRQSLSSIVITEHFSVKKRYLFKKRLLDISISLLVLVTLCPFVFPLIAVMIKLNSRGPVFFKQKRVGFMGKVFVCYKFRTMYVNDQADLKPAVDGDERITRIGQFLRKTCLDELPQFINVLMGDMSIVGPRPHMIAEYTHFSRAITDYSYRTLARPGITGLSQVFGFRGPINKVDDMRYRYQWDVYYMRRVSFRLDLWIMAQTVVIMARGIANSKEPESRGGLKIVNI